MDLDQTASAKLAYLVHDIDDAAVGRRVELLVAEGFIVNLGGFYRHGPSHAGAPKRGAVTLGATTDARLGQRALAVLRHLVSPGSVDALCGGASVIVARNLEMLVLAWRARSPGQRLVYECLDIHRLMLGAGYISRLLRWAEHNLLRRTDLVIVSSPAFATEYFDRRQGRSDGVLLVENKVPDGAPASARIAREPRRIAHPGGQGGRRFVIGWFGMLRCRQTLQQLLALAHRSGGRIEVVIAGLPSPAQFPDFADMLTDKPNVRYLGPYKPSQLAELYAGVDFVWAVDYFEEGLNSKWLLPNRLYEGLAHGAVPIALRKVETGRWLDRAGVGLLVDDPVTDLLRILGTLTAEHHARMRASIGDLPRETLYQTKPERRAIAEAIAGRAHG